jgi:hypothetical protein
VKTVKFTLSILLMLICSTLETTAQRMFIQSGTPVKIVDVKNIGISAANQTKSIIEIRWQADFAPNKTVKSFEIKLEVIYTDGAVITAQSSANATARSGRVEVPTTHLSPGQTPAIIKSMKASVMTVFIETTTQHIPT